MTITPRLLPGQRVRHVVEEDRTGVVTAFMVRGDNHSYEVQWAINQSFWHLDMELVDATGTTTPIGFWREKVD